MKKKTYVCEVCKVEHRYKSDQVFCMSVHTENMSFSRQAQKKAHALFCARLHDFRICPGESFIDGFKELLDSVFYDACSNKKEK